MKYDKSKIQLLNFNVTKFNYRKNLNKWIKDGLYFKTTKFKYIGNNRYMLRGSIKSTDITCSSEIVLHVEDKKLLNELYDVFRMRLLELTRIAIITSLNVLQGQVSIPNYISIP